jgi:outer membrane receptor protein involved in Fe transport
MKSKQIVVAALLGASAVAGSSFVELGTAHAQDATSGAIQGVVKDESTGEALPGVTVVVSSGGTQPQTTLTDENGFYKVTSLPPGGGYLVTFYYADIVLERRNIQVGVNKTAPVYVKINTNQAGGETIVVVDSVPTIDPTSTTQGITLDTEYLSKIPVPGRDFESALGAAAGSQNDGLGTSFSGSTSLENQYYVDGVNTTGLTYGTTGSSVINDFIEEIEVITGGYNAEYGRATGGVVNVVTKTGTNEIAGTVFGSISPGFLIAQRDRTPTQASSIDNKIDTDYEMDFGFEVGGPIIKDRAWFWVGFAPQFGSATALRTTKRRSDCRTVLADGTLSTPADQSCSDEAITMYQDGEEDTDPETGFYIYENLDERELSVSSQAYAILGKVNFAVTPEHQGQVSYQGTPYSGDNIALYGNVDRQQYEYGGFTQDVSAKWTSKFNDNKTEVEAVVGVHRATSYERSKFDELNDDPAQVLYYGTLGNWSQLGGESMRTLNGCRDNTPEDPYQFISNCPDEGIGYLIGGPGWINDDLEQRLAGKISAVQRVKALGTHEIKAGLDIEDNQIENPRVYSGGVFLENLQGNFNRVYAHRWIKLGPPETGIGEDALYPNRCGTGDDMNPNWACRFLGQDDPASTLRGQTVNWSAYARDSWQVKPNFTLNYGLRYEEQRLRFTKDLQNTHDPLTGRDLGKNAMVMRGMWAPRLGVLYDWTKEGRSKLYSHWGRFYESIPMDINNRSFGGEVSYQQIFRSSDQCGGTVDGFGGPNGEACLEDPDQVAGLGESILGAGTLVAPGIKPQFMDEVIFGVEYEIMEDLKLGVSYQNRRLGRVIEDVSTDGAATYIIANPGEWSSEEENTYVGQISELDQNGDGVAEDPDNQVELDRLTGELEQFRGIRVFDKPQRDYNALQMTVTRRFSKSLYMQGSYTYSRTTGNFPGLFSPDNGQVDPNISSQYDLIELLANRNGPLPQDRPHYVKLDGYYTFDFKKAGEATAGIRFRALSGIPQNVLGRHWRYGPSESFILPRGEIRRTDFETGLDVHLDYGRDIGRGMKLFVYADLFNVFNDQGTFGVDNNYTYRSYVNPISGGQYEDLIWLKENDQSGIETSSASNRNPNYGNVSRRYAPFSARFGARLTF